MILPLITGSDRVNKLKTRRPKLYITILLFMSLTSIVCYYIYNPKIDLKSLRSRLSGLLGKSNPSYQEVDQFVFSSLDIDPRVFVGLNETGLPFDIVPNIVHYILFSVDEIHFSHFVSILSVLKNQRPELIYIHCDCHQLRGQYWDRTLRVTNRTNTTIIVRHIEKPTEIFGHKLSEQYLNWHSSDLTRIRVLLEFGGIYLDRDVYVVQPLNRFFKYEMTLDWDKNYLIEIQTIIATKNARFLKLFLKSYHFYDGNQWVYNSEELPTNVVLKRRPDLIHRVYGRFGPWGPTVCPLLYKTYYKNWRTEYYAFHLYLRGNEISMKNWVFNGNTNYPKYTAFDEQIINVLNVTFGEMTRDLFDFENNFKS